ncbi:hypothetical protein N656DRAFT_403877 [Canariomyces notabilis]|uniref:Uncharacterized protein n=1 Tax=Canariomyces notabilis TaxID=2074819 RepID=A0AAN6YWU8_9PEZI|nr:hypothetical protein N656DRAFT_403877 [Canariomyces arenarius]
MRHLLPISEVFSFEEAVAHLNDAIASRLLRQDSNHGTNPPMPHPTRVDWNEVLRWQTGGGMPLGSFC